MRVRIFTWDDHTDPLRLADKVNECIKSCENIGETVLDANVLVHPNEGAPHGMEYLVVIKCEGSHRTFLPLEDAVERPEVQA